MYTARLPTLSWDPRLLIFTTQFVLYQFCLFGFYKVTQRDTSPEMVVGNFRLTHTHTHLKELLNDVVAKHIHHQLIGCLQDLCEDQLPLRWIGPLQLQLDEPKTTTTSTTLLIKQQSSNTSSLSQWFPSKATEGKYKGEILLNIYGCQM